MYVCNHFLPKEITNWNEYDSTLLNFSLHTTVACLRGHSYSIRRRGFKEQYLLFEYGLWKKNKTLLIKIKPENTIWLLNKTQILTIPLEYQPHIVLTTSGAALRLLPLRIPSIHLHDYYTAFQ